MPTTCCVIGAARWEVGKVVQQAERTHAPPSDCPQGLLFVPPPPHSSVLQWGHDSHVACHLGLALIRQSFWWPTMTGNMWQRAPSVPMGKPLIVCFLVSRALCLFLIAHGPTSLSTLSLV